MPCARRRGHTMVGSMRLLPVPHLPVSVVATRLHRSQAVAGTGPRGRPNRTLRRCRSCCACCRTSRTTGASALMASEPRGFVAFANHEPIQAAQGLDHHPHHILRVSTLAQKWLDDAGAQHHATIRPTSPSHAHRPSLPQGCLGPAAHRRHGAAPPLQRGLRAGLRRRRSASCQGHIACNESPCIAHTPPTVGKPSAANMHGTRLYPDSQGFERDVFAS